MPEAKHILRAAVVVGGIIWAEKQGHKPIETAVDGAVAAVATVGDLASDGFGRAADWLEKHEREKNQPVTITVDSSGGGDNSTENFLAETANESGDDVREEGIIVDNYQSYNESRDFTETIHPDAAEDDIFEQDGIKWHHPVPGRVTTVWATHGTLIKDHLHAGFDFGRPSEDDDPHHAIRPIVADTGIVSYAGQFVSYEGVSDDGTKKGGLGNFVRINYDLTLADGTEGFDVIYAHMEELSVQTGQMVGPNTMIGRMGARGNAEGAMHLHMEMVPTKGSGPLNSQDASTGINYDNALNIEDYCPPELLGFSSWEEAP